ncbi:phage tail tape measure protein [Halocynthiibacter styelae]|uniref:Phage tail tape measure protein n=1 Tax=Halocynthiibacter styelae TaxID=2761955 RepID=A0A8J7INK6_9RHOB|nr:phage tail tape measure protein [Paenihalocynthiibacter styelae]MBI1494101.1 phage tail tape measure protein [Paenihalocynthiibacter styelae]
MAEFDEVDNLDQSLETLETALGSATGMTQAFGNELSRLDEAMGGTAKEVTTLSRGVSRGLKRAIDGLVFDGDKLSVALDTVAQSMLNTAYSVSVKPVTDRIGGLIGEGMNSLFNGLFQFADGGSFAQGRVMPFANGGIVSGPTMFPMRGGTGLMGEAGPEAIMPLSRGSDGRLGVRTDGSNAKPVQVVMNISTPDVSGFQRSRSQIAAQMGRALGQGARNR